MRIPRRISGFTVVELIVATAITVAMAAIIIGIVSNVLSSVTRSTGKLVCVNSAHIALNQLAKDLQGAMFKSDGGVWFAATITDGSDFDSRGWIAAGGKPVTIDVTQNDIADCRFGIAGMWLRLITSTPRFATQDNLEPTTLPAAVSYQIVRRKLGGSQVDATYMLFRSQVRATTFVPDPARPAIPQDAGTFQVGYNLDPASGNLYAAADDAEAGNPGTIVRPRREDVIAANVIDFGLRFYAADGTLLFPKPDETDYLARSGAGGKPMPASVEIYMRVLTSDGERQIHNLEDNRIDGDWWTIALANSTTFVRRVDIRANDL